MTTPRSQEEDLAAFLDGTLSAAERRRVLERAAADPALYDLLVEASGTLAELDAAMAQPDGAAVAPRPWQRSAGTRWAQRVAWPLVGLAAAAVLAVVLLNPTGRDAADPTGLLALAESVDVAGLPEGAATLAMSPWQASRGERDASEEARVTRAGMRLADMAAAVTARDAGAAATIAGDLALELDGVLGAAPVVAGLRAAAAEATAGTDEWPASVGSAAASTVRVFDSLSLRLGLWLETVRLAALAGDSDLLRSPGLAAAGRSVAEESPAPTAGRILELVVLLTERPAPRPDSVLPLVEALVPGR